MGSQSTWPDESTEITTRTIRLTVAKAPLSELHASMPLARADRFDEVRMIAALLRGWTWTYRQEHFRRVRRSLEPGAIFDVQS